jgi:hypothetical protein
MEIFFIYVSVCLYCVFKKIRPFRGRERPVLAKSSGEEGKLVYKDGPDG